MTKEFPKGLIVKTKNEKAPEYVIANITIHKNEFIEWLKTQPDDYINIGLNYGQSGKPYAFLDTWKPQQK